MTEKNIEFGSSDNVDIINQTYDKVLVQAMDLLRREDFYGIVAWKGVPFFGEKLGLTPQSHLLDLCSGIGGPARYFAKTYGCKITGIDLSKSNHITAQKRTKDAGLDHLVNFLHGNALEFSFPASSFTHVFGCEALCYFPDKVHLYKAAHQVLKPGGVIAFLEAACETPIRLRTEEHIAPVKYESVAQYTRMLQAAGFEQIQHFDTTQLASQDVAQSMVRLLTKKDELITLADVDLYYGMLEIWAEFLAYFSEGQLTHCGLIAKKK